MVNEENPKPTEKEIDKTLSCWEMICIDQGSYITSNFQRLLNDILLPKEKDWLESHPKELESAIAFWKSNLDREINCFKKVCIPFIRSELLRDKIISDFKKLHKEFEKI